MQRQLTFVREHTPFLTLFKTSMNNDLINKNYLPLSESYLKDHEVPSVKIYKIQNSPINYVNQHDNNHLLR